MGNLVELSSLMEEKNILEKKYKNLNEFLVKCNDSIDKLRKSKQYVLDSNKELLSISDSEKFRKKSFELESTSNEINEVIIQLEQVIIPEIQMELTNTQTLINEIDQKINILKLS